MLYVIFIKNKQYIIRWGLIFGIKIEDFRNKAAYSNK